MGAAPAGSTDWDERDGDLAPVVYVRPGERSGDGSRAAPVGSLAAALAREPRAATVLVGRGTLALTDAIRLRGGVTLRGAGAGVSVIESSAAGAAVRVEGEVTLEGLTVRAAPGVVAVDVPSEGAVFTARDLTVERGATGLRAGVGATICAERVTVAGTSSRGLSVEGGAAFVRGAWVRGGDSFGVVSDRGHLTLLDSLVEGHARDGVAVRGSRLGEACARDEDCAAPTGVCPGFVVERVCARGPRVDDPGRCLEVAELRDVASLRNGVTAARFERATPTAEEISASMSDEVLARPGPVARVTRAVLAGTTVPLGAVGGDGLYVGPGATLSVDPQVMSDEARGAATEVVGNARAGVLVDGDRTAGPVPSGLRAAGRLEARGLRVASNGGPGLFVQSRAALTALSFSDVIDNSALGLGVTSGASVALIQCTRFVATREGVIVPEDTTTAPFRVGDGLSLADGVAPTEVVEGEFSDNARFGVVLSNAELELRGVARGVGNGFRGVGRVGAAPVVGAESIEGRAEPPATFRVVRGPVGGGG